MTSADESRTKVYLVRFGDARPRRSRPSAACLRGAITVGFSLLVATEGGSVDDLDQLARRAAASRRSTCLARGRVRALHPRRAGLRERGVRGALPRRPPCPRAADREERGVRPRRRPRVATCRSSGRTACAARSPRASASCSTRAGASTHSMPVRRAGTSRALYALHEGEWVSYILGAPDFVNAAFRELFADGLPAVTPLVVKSEGPPGPTDRSSLPTSIGSRRTTPRVDPSAGFTALVAHRPGPARGGRLRPGAAGRGRG